MISDQDRGGRETGAREPHARTDPDPRDAFSQDAAANKPPKGGLGLTQMNDNGREGRSGTTDEKPRWEGPPENRPRGYLPAEDDPSSMPDAAGDHVEDDEKPEQP